MNLPLNNGTNDEPIIIPSKNLITEFEAFVAGGQNAASQLKYLEAGNPCPLILLGNGFTTVNKKIKELSQELSNTMHHENAEANVGGDRGDMRGFRPPEVDRLFVDLGIGK